MAAITVPPGTNGSSDISIRHAAGNHAFALSGNPKGISMQALSGFTIGIAISNYPPPKGISMHSQFDGIAIRIYYRTGFAIELPIRSFDPSLSTRLIGRDQEGDFYRSHCPFRLMVRDQEGDFYRS